MNMNDRFQGRDISDFVVQAEEDQAGEGAGVELVRALINKAPEYSTGAKLLLMVEQQVGGGEKVNEAIKIWPKPPKGGPMSCPNTTSRPTSPPSSWVDQPSDPGTPMTRMIMTRRTRYTPCWQGRRPGGCGRSRSNGRRGRCPGSRRRPGRRVAKGAP